MQKLINVLAVLSFGVSAGVVAGGVYVYTQKDALIEEAKAKATEAIGEIIADQLVSTMNGSLGDGLLGGTEDSDVSSPVPIPVMPF